MASVDPSKVVIITGASRGIGHAIATHLLSSTTTNLVLISRTAAPLRVLEATCPARVEVVVGDLAVSGSESGTGTGSASSPSLGAQAVSLALQRWARLDGMVLNHGILGPIGRVGKTNESQATGSELATQWARVMDVNFFSQLDMVSHALPHLRLSCHRHGAAPRIVLVSSGAATKGYAAWGAYGASKAALNHLALTLAAEEPAILTLAVRPGNVNTDMQVSVRANGEHMDRVDRERFVGLSVEGNLLPPELPGRVLARLVIGERNGEEEGDERKKLSGRFLK